MMLYGLGSRVEDGGLGSMIGLGMRLLGLSAKDGLFEGLGRMCKVLAWIRG